MRFILLSAVFLFAAVAVWSQNHSIRQKFKSKDYTVTWGIAPNYPSDAKLVIGYGSGHGGSLGWLRFHPGSGGVEVLSIELDEGWRPYKSKWAPDVAPVTVKRGRMSQKSYTVLLRNIAIVSSVRLKPVTRNSARWSSADFWVATSVSHHNKSLLDLNWAGYASSMDEIDYAQPEAAVSLVRKAVAKVPLKEDSLTTDDRRWASAKFVQDWNALGGRKSYWWVAERLLLMVGVVG